MANDSKLIFAGGHCLGLERLSIGYVRNGQNLVMHFKILFDKNGHPKIVRDKARKA